MQLHDTRKTTLAAALLSLAIGAAPAFAIYAQEPAGPALDPPVAAPPVPDPAAAPDAAPASETGVDADGVETLTRGPVHEAFAAPAAADPTPAETVKDKPPEPIDEVAPEFKPEGAIWIPGYWEWDVAGEEYIWISGLWRLPPPGMRWVPPYWTEVDGGWQRVPGFWLSADVTELEYREAPPESLDVGPSTPAPGENYFYIPGSWSHYDSGYRWRTGYWSPYRADWVWIPARWHWTPAGCVYGGGYWDRRPLVRGHLFAPLAFRSNVYRRPGWRYRPWCVLDTNRLFVHLWFGPRFNNYYFGNYYGGYNRFGFTPWCDWNYRHRRCYDPLWSWSSVHYRRHGIDYIGRVRGWHQHYARHEHDRPGRTWKEQRRLIADGRGGRDGNRGQNVLASELREVARRDNAPLRLARVDDQERDRVRSVSEEIRKLHTERSKLEREARVARTAGDAAGPRTEGAGTTRDGDRPGRDGQAGDSGRGRSGRRTATKVSLPKASDAARRAARTVEQPQTLEPDRNDGDPGRTAGTGQDRSDDRKGSGPARPDRSETASASDGKGNNGKSGKGKSGQDGGGGRSKRGSDNTASDAARSVQERIRAAREAATARDAGGKGAAASKGSSDAASSAQDRIRAAREAADAGRGKGPDRPTARGSGSKGNQPRVERSEAPRIERPEAPRVERSEAPRPRDTPRLEAPRAERRMDTPRIETRRPEAAPRIERTQPPRIQPSRGSGSGSRASSSSGGNSSRGSVSRGSGGSSSRASASRSSGGSRASASRPSGGSRASASRPSGGSRSSASRGSGGGGSRNSRSSRGRD